VALGCRGVSCRADFRFDDRIEGTGLFCVEVTPSPA